MSKPALASASAVATPSAESGAHYLRVVRRLLLAGGGLRLLARSHILRPSGHHLRHRPAHADRSGAVCRRRSREPPDLQCGEGGDGPQPAGLAPVRPLRVERRAWRSRHLDPDRPPGDGRSDPRLPRHGGNGHGCHHHRHRARHPAGRLGRGLSQQRAGPDHARRRADRLFGADLLARHHGPAGLLSRSAMGGRSRPHRRLL